MLHPNAQSALRALNAADNFKDYFDNEPQRVHTRTGSALDYSTLYLSAGDCLDAPENIPTGKRCALNGAYVKRA